MKLTKAEKRHLERMDGKGYLYIGKNEGGKSWGKFKKPRVFAFKTKPEWETVSNGYPCLGCFRESGKTQEGNGFIGHSWSFAALDYGYYVTEESFKWLEVGGLYLIKDLLKEV